MVGKMRWGDSAELDDDGDFEVALPAAQVRAPPPPIVVTHPPAHGSPA